MKRIICATAMIAGILYTSNIMAQEKTEDTTKKKKNHMLYISNKGITLEDGDSTKKKVDQGEKEKTGRVRLTFSMLDLGVNMLNDNTTYTDPTVVSYLKVPSAQRNADLFDLKNGKSINVNIYPIMAKLPIVKTKKQRLYLATGLGMQIYNFRFDNPITYVKNPNAVVMDSIAFKKNKLGVYFVNIPLMLTSKTKLHKSTWLVYGVGASAGYRISSWNKQVSGTRGKVKTHGNFDMSDYNTCLTAEFGVEGIIRFYGSYQLNSLYNNGIDQRPISVGIRIGGI